MKVVVYPQRMEFTPSSEMAKKFLLLQMDKRVNQIDMMNYTLAMKRRGVAPVIKAVYGYNIGNTIVLHRGHGEIAIRRLENSGVECEITKVDPPEAREIEKVNWSIPVKLRKDQQPVVDWSNSRKSDYVPQLFSCPPAFGKALADDEHVLTTKGYRLMGDIMVGDYAIGSDGLPTKVLGVYPQGMCENMYSLEFEDGSIVRANDEHLWSVYEDNETDLINVTTEELSTYLKEATSEYHVPLAKGFIGAGDMTENTELPDKPPNLVFEPRMVFASLERREKHLKDILDSCPYNIIRVTKKYKIYIDYLITFLGMVGVTSKIQSYTGYYVVEIVQSDRKKLVAVHKAKPCTATCIKVEAEDQLFICGFYTLTHNTFISIETWMGHGGPALMIMRPGYMSQWIKELLEKTTVEKEDIFKISSKVAIEKLQGLIESGEANYKVYVASNKTYQRWISKYHMLLKSDSTIDDINPDTLTSKLGVSTVIIDEIHQDIHMNFMCMMHTSAKHYIGLSGTFVTTDSFIKQIQTTMFPAENRYDALRVNPYINYIVYTYNIKARINTSFKGRSTYSHNAYEQWILSLRWVRDKYYEMVIEAIKMSYFQFKTGNQRCLVYMASVNMVNDFAEYLKVMHSEMNITPFTQLQKYEDLISADISIATPGKASTAVDIPELISVVDTTSSNSIQEVIQKVGRLRRIDEPVLTYIQLVCGDIPKHVKYQQNRNGYLRGVWKNMYELTYSKVIRNN